MRVNFFSRCRKRGLKCVSYHRGRGRPPNDDQHPKLPKSFKRPFSLKKGRPSKFPHDEETEGAIALLLMNASHPVPAVSSPCNFYKVHLKRKSRTLCSFNTSSIYRLAQPLYLRGRGQSKRNRLSQAPPLSRRVYPMTGNSGWFK